MQCDGSVIQVFIFSTDFWFSFSMILMKTINSSDHFPCFQCGMLKFMMNSLIYSIKSITYKFLLMKLAWYLLCSAGPVISKSLWWLALNSTTAAWWMQFAGVTTDDAQLLLASFVFANVWGLLPVSAITDSMYNKLLGSSVRGLKLRILRHANRASPAAGHRYLCPTPDEAAARWRADFLSWLTAQHCDWLGLIARHWTHAAASLPHSISPVSTFLSQFDPAREFILQTVRLS